MKLQTPHLALLQRVFEGSDIERIELVSASERLVLSRGSEPGPVVPPRGSELRVAIENVSLFRWTDGDWIVAVQIEVTNDGQDPTRIAPALFALRGATPFYPWLAVTTLPDQILQSRASIHGTVGFFTSGRSPEPISVEPGVRSTEGGEPRWLGALTPTRGDDRGVAPQDINVVPTPMDDQSLMLALAASLRADAFTIEFSDAVTFRWSDEDWIATVQLHLVNRSQERLPVSRGLVQCTANGLAMRPWSASSTFPEFAWMEAGAELSAMVGFFYHRTLPQPQQITCAYGPVSRPACYVQLEARLEPPRLAAS